MYLQELIESITQDYLNNPDDIDRRMNREAHLNNSSERKWRKKQGSGVITKPAPSEPETRFSNQPKEDVLMSPGYKGLQRVLKKTGQDYNKDALGPDSSFSLRNDPTFTRSFNQLPR